ncbi:glycoside hydrolase family 78 protein [Streptomyces antibioticus]|uniref:glycoside hydrolase family 78 protein n=1 Tax=Streptomyces antibioticus TaxID=1890 RepID=UPI0036ABC374
MTAVRFEHVRDALGVGTGRPRLTWSTVTPAGDWTQAAYEVELTAADGAAATAKVDSADSVLVPWPFDPLPSRARVTVRVRVTGPDGEVSPWSEPATAEVGLLGAGDWSAVFVTPEWDEDPQTDQPSPLLRREFELRGPVRAARLYSTALGVYEAEINGRPVGDDVLAPGWTAYDERLRYRTHDVTALLRPGRNAIGAILADGWFRGRLGFDGKTRAVYGDRLALLAQLEVVYEDGTTERICTDGSWRAATGPVISSSIYDGETHDARLERSGWSEPGHDDEQGWRGVRVVERDLDTLVAPDGPPVRRTEEVAPVSVATTPSGKTLLDFGQNLVGRLRLTVSGDSGTTLILRHAEVLEDGELCTRPLRHAAATDTYTLRGEGAEVFEPRFTFHGFRYAEITGRPDGFDPAADVRAVVLHSDLERTGSFECSDPLVNRLHDNVVRSMRGNFLDVPTDCPQRDERLGWTGDIQVFAPTASFLYDSAGFLTSWLADLAAEQGGNGVVPFVVPKVVPGADTPTAAWGDAATLVPWTLYERYADTGILAAQYDSMRGWVDHVASLAGDNHLWDSGFQFGDWLDPTAPAGRPEAAATPGELVATAYFARSAEILARTAGILARTEDAERYRALADEVRAAFRREYVTAAGRMMSDAPTAYALALCFDLLESDEQRAHAGTRLAQLVRAGGHRIATGFVGTPLICDALTRSGHTDTAYRLLLQQECPSWLYPVTMGATTIWERWDSMLPDGTVNPSGMTSFNHYALGAVADWLHRTVAGLAPAEPGYRRLRVEPRPGGGLTHARAALRTPYGSAEVSWSVADGELTVRALVPPNTRAEILLPGAERTEVGSGRHTWSVPFRADEAERTPLSVDMSVDDLLAREDASRVFKEVLVAHVPEAAGFIESSVGAPTGMTVRVIAGMLPNGEEFLADLERQFAELDGRDA